MKYLLGVVPYVRFCHHNSSYQVGFALASHTCTAGWSLGMEARADLPISFELKWKVFNKDPLLERIK
jgi:hypothetical protein